MTALPYELLAAFFVGQFILAGVAVLIGYKLLEINWTLGFLGSIILGTTILVAEVYAGDLLWNPGLNGAATQEVAIATVAGATLAVMLVVTTFKQDTDHGSIGDSARTEWDGPTNDSPDIPNEGWEN